MNDTPLSIEEKIAAMAATGNTEAMIAWAIVRLTAAIKGNGDSMANSLDHIASYTSNLSR